MKKVDFPILLELKLSNNKIKNIEVFENIGFKYSLKRLYLSHNLISNISPLIDRYCEHNKYNKYYKCNCIIIHLTELNLAGNYIDKIENKDIIDDMRIFIKHFVI